MTRQCVHDISRHCSAQRPRREYEDGAAAGGESISKQLRLSLLLIVFLALVSSNFPVAIAVVSSTSSTISPATPQRNSNSSSAPVQHFHRRVGRFSTMEKIEPLNARRRLAGQYRCRWKPNICEQDPIRFLLGPDCCNSMCTDMRVDMFNCGTCGNICFYGSICCNGVCIDMFNDNQNCGGCDSPCPWGEVCEFGICGYA